ncbi:MAG: zinc ribbon domain-containing protein [Selenomonadaceae bacterium]|nr:zinc ribbon domain-containing protein [Selenomonadaceae bacterium]
MAKRNIFEMLGLEFDPPDNIKKIRAAYDNWKKRLTAEQNTTVDPTRLAAIREELQMDGYISLTLDNPRFRQREAESLKQQRVEELRLYIDIQRGDTSGTLQVNQSQIRQVRDKLRLSLSTIEATYKEQGFEIKPAKTTQKILATLNNFFLSDSVMEELKKNFATFRTVPDEKNFAWSANVHDLYELAFYLENQIEPSADFYKRRDTEELREIFREEAKKVSAPIPQWQSIKALLNLAQTQVFNTDDSRFKYDHSLKIESLTDFFAKIKSAPEIFKRDSYFADNCINRIRRTFPNLLNYELSAALYNKAAGLLRDPYEAVDAAGEISFCLTCANCGAFENFRTREEAERSRCKNCGENFYIDCPKCGKKIPATAEHCTACDFSFVELKNFSKYIGDANSMLDLVEQARTADESVNIVTAEIVKLLAKARQLKPESHELKKIEWRINKTATELKKRELYSWAEKKLPSLSISPDKAVSDCVEILRKIKDYKPAQDRLRLIPPRNPPAIIATLKENYSPPPNSPSIGKISVNAKSTNSSTGLICNISWQAANDLGIAYTLIKKVDGEPQTYRDGEILIENTDKLEFTDTDVKPGVLYGYAVFSTRLGTISSPKTATAVHYSDLDEKKLIAKTEDGNCKFIWRLPSENCLGVRILRSDNAGNSVVVAECEQSSFTDKNVKNRKQYQYRLQCVYYAAEDNVANNEKYFARGNEEIYNKVWKIDRNYKYSHGLTVSLTPEQPPKLVEDLICSVKGGRVSFKWKSTGDFSIWFKEVSNKKEPAQIDKKIFSLDDVDEILGSGVVYKKAESNDETCEFALSNDSIKLAVISATKEFGLINEIITCANVEPCEIDTEKTQIDAGGLKLVLKSVPENLYMIHYKINTKDSDELYATIETAKARQMNRIYATKYAQDTFIAQTHLPPKEIYITVIGEYKFSDGTAAYSAPSTLVLNNRPKEIISYHLEWGTSGFFNKEIHAKDCKLIIESTAHLTPKMFLVCRRDGRMNIELGDSSTRILGAVREYPTGYKDGQLKIDLQDEIWKDISAGTVVKLLTSKEDEQRFELKASRPDTLTVPKK